MLHTFTGDSGVNDALAPPVLNRHVRKFPITQIGVVSRTDTAVSQKKTNTDPRNKYFRSQTFLAGGDCGSFEIHAPQCNPERSTCGGTNPTRRFSFLHSGSILLLTFLSALNVFAAASFQPLP